MNYSNDQLKVALAKMLPDDVAVNPGGEFSWYWRHKNNTTDCKVLDTELLHLCWMVEENMTNKQWVEYENNELNRDVHATWQQRVIALCKVKGVEIV